MVKPIALIRACALQPIVELVRLRGAPLERLLESAGLPRASLDAPEELVPLRSAVQLLREAPRCGELGAAVVLAQPGVGLATFGDFGRRLLHCATLGEALETAVRLQRLYGSGGRTRLASEGDRTWLRHLPDPCVTAGCPEAEH